MTLTTYSPAVLAAVHRFCEAVASHEPLMHEGRNLEDEVEVLRPGGKWAGVPFIRPTGANQYLRAIGLLPEGKSLRGFDPVFRDCGFCPGPKSLWVDERTYLNAYAPAVDLVRPAVRAMGYDVGPHAFDSDDDTIALLRRLLDLETRVRMR